MTEIILKVTPNTFEWIAEMPDGVTLRRASRKKDAEKEFLKEVSDYLTNLDQNEEAIKVVEKYLVRQAL